MCGEKPNRILWEHWKEGSPPHVRGKVFCDVVAYAVNRITPAYAGKSRPHRACTSRRKDHPRMCGEKWKEPCRRFLI